MLVISGWSSRVWTSESYKYTVFQFKYLKVPNQLHDKIHQWIELKMNPVLGIENSVPWSCGIFVAEHPLLSSSFWTWMIVGLQIQKSPMMETSDNKLNQNLKWFRNWSSTLLKAFYKCFIPRIYYTQTKNNKS